jgi:hypothetical protein
MHRYFFRSGWLYGHAPQKNLTFILLQRLLPVAVRSGAPIDQLMSDAEHRMAD